MTLLFNELLTSNLPGIFKLPYFPLFIVLLTFSSRKSIIFNVRPVKFWFTLLPRRLTNGLGSCSHVSS